MDCPRCGKPVPVGQTFCPFCGVDVRPASARPSTGSQVRSACLIALLVVLLGPFVICGGASLIGSIMSSMSPQRPPFETSPAPPLPFRPPAPIPPMPATGRIGVGTWLTQAEFRDVRVTNGATLLYRKDFAAGATDWTPDGGTWQAKGHVLRQSSLLRNCRDTVGDPRWRDFVLHLQARKTGGAEGFLILFRVQDHNNFVWWNVGGWGNTRTALECVHGGSDWEQIGPSPPVRVKTGQWYDIRIEVNGRRVRCFLDGKLVTDAETGRSG